MGIPLSACDIFSEVTSQRALPEREVKSSQWRRAARREDKSREEEPLGERRVSRGLAECARGAAGRGGRLVARLHLLRSTFVTRTSPTAPHARTLTRCCVAPLQKERRCRSQRSIVAAAAAAEAAAAAPRRQSMHRAAGHSIPIDSSDKTRAHNVRPPALH